MHLLTCTFHNYFLYKLVDNFHQSLSNYPASGKRQIMLLVISLDYLKSNINSLNYPVL